MTHPSFLDSDPASVLRNVGVPKQADGDTKAKVKPASVVGDSAFSKEKSDKADSYSDSDLGRYGQ